MKILATSDMHGFPEFYDAALHTAREADAQLVILAGDLGPEYYGSPDLIESQNVFLATAFAAFARALTDDGRQLAVVLGNHDWACLEPVYLAMEERGLLTYLHNRCVPVPGAPGYELVGFNFVPPTRFTRKDHERLDLAGDTVSSHVGHVSRSGGPLAFEYVAAADWLGDQPTLQDELASLPAPRDWSQTILVSHGPPFDSNVDKVNHGRSIGSRALRSFVERHQPLVGLHGHAHESPRVTGAFHDRIGESLVMNAGQITRGERVWHGITFDLSDPRGTAVHNQLGAVAD